MPKTGKAPSRPLTIYLLKAGHTPETAVKDLGKLRKFSVGENGSIGDLYLSVAPARPPRWVSLFRGATSPELPVLLGSPPSGVLLIENGGHFFALTFGYGRHLIMPGTYEENFGLIVTLNSVPGDRIRSIDVTSFDAISSHSRTQASREGSIREFGMDIEQDLLRAVTGTPADTTLGARLTGMDALHTVVQVNLCDLPALLGRYYERHQDQGYKTLYPWIDQIAEVRDSARRAKLDDALVDRLRRGNLDRLWLAVPEILDWTDVGGFRYSRTSGDGLHLDLHARDFLATLRDPTALTTDCLRTERVRCFSASTDMPRETWTVYQCVYCEIDEGGEMYLLSAGRWYRVAKSFVSDVNAAIGRLALVDEPLPAYEAGDRTEGDYNRRIAAGDPAHYALMDAKMIEYGGGKSTIEFCDLFTKDRRMIHVKRYSGSSTLSHLFAQGELSGNLFVAEKTFREKVIAKLPASHRDLVPTKRPAPDTFEVMFCVVSRSKKPIAEALPFFSRLNLRNRARVLANYGYRVSLAKIQASS
jgi:uncharacterized protein (TIGR04141 family)